MATPAPFRTALTDMLDIQYPIIVAPMFLISNTAMVKAATDAGITAAIPALNYRSDREFRQALEELRQYSNAPFGINLITNPSNPRYPEQLQTCIDYKVDFIITSLGNPQKVIDACRPQGMRVFCDVVNAEHAEKAVKAGCDALIAVNSEAGGHLGNMKAAELIPLLKKNFDVPVISAGGVGTGGGIMEKIKMGAAGVSMGSIFIATNEAPVTQAYKQACVDYKAKDITITTKLSGTPCTVINTDYVKEIGTKQNWLETLLNRHKSLKKYAKMLTFMRGMKSLEKAAFGATYKNVWVAGASIEHVHNIEPLQKVVERLVQEMKANV